MKNAIIGAIAITLIGGAVFWMAQRLTSIQVDDSSNVSTSPSTSSFVEESEGDELELEDISIERPESENSPAGIAAISREEVSQNNTSASCWTIVEGNVYDITGYIPQHPGGVSAISTVCGEDGTSQFQAQPSHTRSAEQQLEQFLLGPLQS